MLRETFVTKIFSNFRTENSSLIQLFYKTEKNQQCCRQICKLLFPHACTKDYLSINISYLTAERKIYQKISKLNPFIVYCQMYCGIRLFCVNTMYNWRIYSLDLSIFSEQLGPNSNFMHSIKSIINVLNYSVTVNALSISPVIWPYLSASEGSRGSYFFVQICQILSALYIVLCTVEIILFLLLT